MVQRKLGGQERRSPTKWGRDRWRTMTDRKGRASPMTCCPHTGCINAWKERSCINTHIYAHNTHTVTYSPSAPAARSSLCSVKTGAPPCGCYRMFRLQVYLSDFPSCCSLNLWHTGRIPIHNSPLCALFRNVLERVVMWHQSYQDSSTKQKFTQSQDQCSRRRRDACRCERFRWTGGERRIGVNVRNGWKRQESERERMWAHGGWLVQVYHCVSIDWPLFR